MQFHLIVNPKRKEYLAPEAFGDGRTLLEFTRGPSFILTALAWLIAEDNGRGEGDAPSHPLVGSWARDSVVIVGDYGDEAGDGRGLYALARECFTNISQPAIAMLSQDVHLRARFVELGRGKLILTALGQE